MISANATYRRLRATATHGTLALQLRERSEMVQQALLIPGYNPPNPNDLFRAGQPGGWPDPYDLTRMWQDDAGTTPMTLANLGTGVGRCITKGNAITLTQANAADRPVWGRHPVSGIRNLLSFSEQLDNAAWSKVNATITANAATAPDGTQTADAIIPNITNGQHRVDQTSTAPAAAVTFSVYLKAAGYNFATIRVGTAGTGVSLLNGTLNGTTGGVVASVVALANSWFRVSVSLTAAGNDVVRINAEETATFAGSFAGDTVSGILVWGAQLELGPTATTYQRVTNRFDITEVGSPSLYYFDVNGVNQSWASNATVNFSTTDKVTVWAGLRKISDAARGMVLELGNAASNSFLLDAPPDVNDRIRFVSRGSASFVAGQAAEGSFPAPVTVAAVGTGSVAEDKTRLLINGVQVSEGTADQGTGNYSNATLHIGRRGGSSLPFNGYIYSLIIAGDNYDTRTIQRFSDWTLKPRRLITA